jgi:hypothetical protein
MISYVLYLISFDDINSLMFNIEFDVRSPTVKIPQSLYLKPRITSQERVHDDHPGHHEIVLEWTL